MTEGKVDGRISFLKETRALFCNVLQARKFKKNGKEVGEAKYDATFVLDAAELTAIKDKAIEVAKARFPGRNLKELAWPFKSRNQMVEAAGKAAGKKGKSIEDAKQKAAELYEEGKFFLKASSKYEPQLSYLDGKKIVEFTDTNRGLAKQKFYNGCYVVAQVNFVAYEGDEDDGVTAYLDQVLWIKDGPKIGGVSAAEAFKGYIGSVSGEDPTGGQGADLDDEIPF
jgi:hypothetical protein